MEARVGDIIETEGPAYTVGEITHEGPSELFSADEVSITVFRSDADREPGEDATVKRDNIARIWRER